MKRAFMPEEYKEEKINVFLDVNPKNYEPANTFLAEKRYKNPLFETDIKQYTFKCLYTNE